ncbi:MAG: tRNA (adenine-N(6)-)-methyltransferase [Flavobacteriales bacterium]|nr:MAG: tRNA (adenine-N(6)-)-methyltransferase [Flavobacteriales bacterium]
MSKPFRCKQFTVHHHKSAMKVGTDSLLLGAWTSLNNKPAKILDIGTGCGILALQMAQRSDALTINAIEHDAESYEQAVENFENSPWPDRLFCYHCTLQEYTAEIDEQYNLIISNPPFYTSNTISTDKRRTNARNTVSLSFKTLLKAVHILLSKNGVFSLILPHSEESNFILLAKNEGFFLQKICRINDKPQSPVKRSLMIFGFECKKVELTHLTLKDNNRQYSLDFKNLLREFYLEF